jgi:hypothetical protein
MQKWKPIRKIVAAALTAGIIFVAQRLGLDLGADEVNDAAQALAPIIVGYLTPGE